MIFGADHVSGKALFPGNPGHMWPPPFIPGSPYRM
jgi:hypothetical protein